MSESMNKYSAPRVVKKSIVRRILGGVLQGPDSSTQKITDRLYDIDNPMSALERAQDKRLLGLRLTRKEKKAEHEHDEFMNDFFNPDDDKIIG